MAAATDISNYARCHKAIQLVCHRAGPCVDSVLQSWHHNKTQLIPHCSRPRPRPALNPQGCSDRGKPKPSSSCQNCVQWGAAVETEYYPHNLKGNMAWKNVNPSVLSSHYMEVAKAFVLRLSTNHTSIQATDFDSASLLKFMMHFGEFHKRDTVTFDIMDKVSNIRNTLSHMKLNENLSLTDQEVSDYFDNIRDMVSCLEKLHPHQFTKAYADDIRSSLTDILQSPVTEQIKQEVLKPFTVAMNMTVISTLEDQFHEHSQVLTTSVKQDLKDHSDTLTANLTQQADEHSNTLTAMLTQQADKHTDTLTAMLTQQADEHTNTLDSVLTQQADAHSDTLTAILAQQADEETQRLGSMEDRLVDRLGSMTDRLVENTEETVGRLRDNIHGKIANVEEVQRNLVDKVEECLTQQSIPVKDEGPLDLARCRKQLKLEYRSSRDKIPLLPGMPEEFASMEDLYVDLELSKNQKHPSGVTKKKLESLHDLCDIKDKQGNSLKRVLVKGGPGSGKTMLVSKLAYDWATRGLQNTTCDLLFALDLREVTEDMDLIDVIQDQLLPKVSKPQLLEYIESNANSIIYLLDSFDELTNNKLGTDLTAMLSNRWLQESLIIVTSRPHKCHEFGRNFGIYTLVDVLELSFQRISEFVVKFLNISPYLQHVYGEVKRQTEGFNTDTEHPNVVQNKKKIIFVLNRLLRGRLKYHSQIKDNVHYVWELYSFLNASGSLYQNSVKLKSLSRDILQTTWKTYGPPIEYIQACSRVRLVMHDLCRANFLERCSSLNSSSELETSSLMCALIFTRQLCQCNVEIQSKVDEIDSDLVVIETFTDFLYKPDETIAKAVEKIRAFVKQLRELCTDMIILLSEIEATISRLNMITSRFEKGLAISHQLLNDDGIRIKRLIESPTLPHENVNDLCRLLKSALIIVKKVQFQFEAQKLASALFSSIQEDTNNERLALQSFCHVYDYDQKNIGGLKKTASNIIRVFENLATLKLHEELQRKLDELQVVLPSFSGHCCVKDLQPIIDQLYSISTILTTPYDNTNDLKPVFYSAMSFLKLITCKSKKDTKKTNKDAISLLTLLKTHEEYRLLSEIPITLTMLCLLWTDIGDATLPETMTTVFEKCMSYMAEHNEVKTLKQENLDYEIVDEKLEDIMKQIGETALKGLLQNKLVFSGKDFNASILSEACRIGLLTKEKKRSKLRSVDMITFMHKSFQEFCAAHYLVHLLEANRDEFTTIVKQMDTKKCNEFLLLLQFCCGLNKVAAEIILTHTVNVFTNAMKSSQPWQSYPDETIDLNTIGGGYFFDLAHVPLLLFKETQIPEFTRILRPFFQIETLIFLVSSNTKSRYALHYFLDCQLKSPEYNLLLHVKTAKIRLEWDCSTQNAIIIGSLLQCMPNLTSLAIFCLYECYQHFSDQDGAILNGFSKLRKLQSLTLGGLGDMMELVNSLVQCRSVTTLRELVINHDTIAGKAIIALISLQTTLSKLYISPFEPSDADRSQSRRQTRMFGNSGSGSFMGFPFFPCFPKDEIKTILESIKSYTSMTQLTLRGCAVPVGSLYNFLCYLRLLDIRCPDSLEKPFDSEGFFNMIIYLGQQLRQIWQENRALFDDRHSNRGVFPSSPLSILRLDNGRLSSSAVVAMAKAFQFIRNLQVLTIGWNSLSEECFPMIAKALILLSHLSNLNLAGNHIGNSIESLCKSLEDKPLKHLNLTYTHLSEPGAVIFARYLQFWPGLVELDLSENHIGKGMQKLNRELKNLVKLKILRLHDTSLTDKGIAGLPLQNLAQLVELDIRGKHQCYGHQGVEGLFRKVHYAGSLKILFLKFKDEWLQANEFLNRCWLKCEFIYKMEQIRKLVLDPEDQEYTIILRQNEVQALREFERNL